MSLDAASASCPFVTLLPAIVKAWEHRAGAGLVLPAGAAPPVDLEPLIEQLRNRLPLLPAHSCAACEPEVADAADKAGTTFDYALELVRQAQAATLRRMMTANRDTRRSLQDASRRHDRDTRRKERPR